MIYCSRCTYPIVAVNLAMDDEKVCSGCIVSDEKSNIDWKSREKIFVDLIMSYKSKSNQTYDCIIPVSGGKDSFFQAHLIKELGFNALLVTYNGNNYSKTGLENVQIIFEIS